MDAETFIEKYNSLRKWDGEIYDSVKYLMDESDLECFEDLLYNELLDHEEICRYSIEIDTGEVDEYDNYFELRILDSLGYPVHYSLYKEDTNLDEKAYKMKKSAEVLKEIITIKKHISSEINRMQRKGQTIETIESILANTFLMSNGNNQTR
jgi:hypothetical protein